MEDEFYKDMDDDFIIEKQQLKIKLINNEIVTINVAEGRINFFHRITSYRDKRKKRKEYDGMEILAKTDDVSIENLESKEVRKIKE